MTECVVQNGGETDVFLTRAGSLVINKSMQVPSGFVNFVGVSIRLCKFNRCSICLNLVLWFDKILVLKSPSKNIGRSLSRTLFKFKENKSQ